ncbi:MAG: hypothetical protein EHM87_12095 [Burkholderiales bacterium]|nr:MAG: hypothetical protein EHM87_12095 [Burkholderiales bacterium]
METKPGSAELIEAAIESIRGELLPALSGRAAFQARVVITVLDTARREVLQAPAADAAELARLRALLAMAHAPDGAADPVLPALRHTLCDAIREGRVDLATPGLADHLWADVLARVAIDQPAYPSFVREAAPAASPVPERTRD